MKRVIIALLVAFGLGCIAVALGMLYLDYSAREKAWVESQMRGRSLNSAEQDELLTAWDNKETFLPAIISGSAGAALFGAGLVLAAFELPVFASPRHRHPNASGSIES